MVYEQRAAGKQMEGQTCIVKCFTEEVMKQVQIRTPFQEIQMNGLNKKVEEDTREENLNRKDCGEDAECSATSWAEFELELSDYESKEISPVVDGLLVELSSDFFFGGNTCSPAAESRPAKADKQAPKQTTNVPAKGPMPQKSPKQTLLQGSVNEESNLIKADYSQQPPVSSHRCNLQSMMAEKSSLKRELRALDIDFEKREGRKPTKAEKEHLRPMYVRYWKLKHQISKLQNVTPKAQTAAVC
eukprot:scaffold28929_cov29-Prasinocladus_malaysianus.AAC.4